MLKQRTLFSLEQLKFQALTRRIKYRTIKISSDFKNKLKETKKLAYLYGNLSFNTIETTAKRATTLSGKQIDNFAILLESRLDVVLYRIKFFKTIPTAREWISNGYVLVNGNPVTVHSYELRAGDVLSIIPEKRNLLHQEMISDITKKFQYSSFLTTKKLYKKDYTLKKTTFFKSFFKTIFDSLRFYLTKPFLRRAYQGRNAACYAKKNESEKNMFNLPNQQSAYKYCKVGYGCETGQMPELLGDRSQILVARKYRKRFIKQNIFARGLILANSNYKAKYRQNIIDSLKGTKDISPGVNPPLGTSVMKKTKSADKSKKNPAGEVVSLNLSKSRFIKFGNKTSTRQIKDLYKAPLSVRKVFNKTCLLKNRILNKKVSIFRIRYYKRQTHLSASRALIRRSIKWHVYKKNVLIKLTLLNRSTLLKRSTLFLLNKRGILLNKKPSSSIFFRSKNPRTGNKVYFQTGKGASYFKNRTTKTLRIWKNVGLRLKQKTSRKGFFWLWSRNQNLLIRYIKNFQSYNKKKWNKNQLFRFKKRLYFGKYLISSVFSTVNEKLVPKQVAVDKSKQVAANNTLIRPICLIKREEKSLKKNCKAAYLAAGSRQITGKNKITADNRFCFLRLTKKNSFYKGSNQYNRKFPGKNSFYKNEYLSSISMRNKRYRFGGIKPINIEVSYKTLTAVYLYSPQIVFFPALIDFDYILRQVWRK